MTPSLLPLLAAWVLAAAIWLERPLDLSPYTAWALSLPLLLGCGAVFHRGLWRAIVEKRANADMLISISLWTSLLLSTAAVFFPETTRVVLFGHWLKPAAALVAMSLLGRLLEGWLTERGGEALGKIIRRVPTSARVERSGREVPVLTKDLCAGDVVLVRPGQPLPADGEVIEGTSRVDESLWTLSGEAVEKTIGARVLGGTQNKSGELRVRVGADAGGMQLVRVVEAVVAAVGSKSARAGVADAIARAYVPAVILTAVSAALIWSWGGPEPRAMHALAVLGTVLMVACPWGIDLAAPAALAAGLRRAAERGIRFRNPSVVEMFERPDVVVLDKKGILTEGRPTVADVICFGKWQRSEILRFAAAAERRSGHPFYEALRAAAGVKPLPKVESFETYPGQGVAATIGGKRVLAGSPAWLAEREATASKAHREQLQGHEDSLMALSIDGKVAGAVTFSDPLRPGVPEAVQELTRMGLEVVLASGDRNAAAHKVAERAGISRVYSEVQQDEKVRIISEIQAGGRKVVMVGEGVRDAAALSRADLGVAVAPAVARVDPRTALGAGIDLAAEAADVLLPGRDLQQLALTLRMSLAIRGAIRSNLRWAFAPHVILLPVAAGALLPSFGISMSQRLVAAATAVGILAACINTIWQFRRRDM
jgi:Cu+-exporting ATPase